MIRAKYKITGHIHAGGGSTPIYPELENIEIIPSANEQYFKSNKYGYDIVKVNAVTIVEHYLEDKNLVLLLPDGSNLKIDISSYINNNELTKEQIEAIENMKFITEGKNLIIEYDDTVLDIDFIREGKNLIIENNIDVIDFDINEKGNLEVIY